MENVYDYRKFAILYVDDEVQSLNYFAKTFQSHFRIFTASDAAQGFQILSQHKDDIALLLADQRMPGEEGVQLLRRARRLQPRILRLLVTAYSDLDAAIRAVNSGAIYKYITKPWTVPELETTLRRGLEFFLVQRERDQLLREKLSVLHEMMMTDRVLSLGLLAAGLNHHIRNSLVAIRTFLDLAPAKLREENVDLHNLKNPHFWQEFYQQVQAQLGRITALLSDLGMAAEPLASSPSQEVQLAEVLACVLETWAPRFAQRGVIVENQVPDTLSPLHVERRKFQRLFELLFADELANLSEGSRLTLRAQATPCLAGAAPGIQLEIQDDGPGLPEEALRAVFDPFHVRNDDPQEFGINLMACYFIVYHHGGKITVQSAPKRGTVFTLTFPTQTPPSSAAQEEREFLPKLLLSETLWQKLLAES